MISIKHVAFLLSASILSTLFPSCNNSSPNTAQLASKTRAGEDSAQSLYRNALAAQQAGKSKRAAKDFRSIFVKYPLSPVAGDSAYRYAKILEKNGDLLEAFDAYDSVVTKYPASSHYAEAIKRQETIAHQVAQGHITSSFIGIKSRIDVSRTTSMLAKVRDNAPRAASADKAQFTIGEIQQSRGSGGTGMARAISAFRKLTRDYPDSPFAPEAQFRIGSILLAQAASGNQDSANLDRAKRAFEDVIIRYPNSKQAKAAKKETSKLASGDIQRSFDVAEFYRKKGQTSSALFYYRETLRKSAPGPLRSQAQSWIQQLGGQ